MKPSQALCLLIVLGCIVAGLAKKKDNPIRPAKSRPGDAGKKEVVNDKNVKKEKPEEENESDETEEESDEEDDSDDSDDDEDSDDDDDDEEQKDNLTFMSSEEFEGTYRYIRKIYYNSCSRYDGQ